MELTATQLAAMSLATSAIGTVVSIAGAAQQASAQAAAFKYQSAVAANNQIIAQRAAEDARKRGELEANIQRQRSRLLVGQQRAALAGAGVLTDVGSALDLSADTAGLGELDALTIQSNAEREAIGFETQGMNFEAESRLTAASARQARTEGLFKVGGTLLTGFSSVASKWSGFKSAIDFDSIHT